MMDVEELRLLLRVEQNFPMCAGCSDVEVMLVGQYCDRCTEIIIQDGRGYDPAASHGRPQC